MKLVEYIMLGRITDPAQLGPDDRQRAGESPGLSNLITENAALRSVDESCPPAPNWPMLRSEVMRRADIIRLSPWQRMLIKLSSPRYAMAGFGAIALLVIFALTALLTLTPTTDGPLKQSGTRQQSTTYNASYSAVRYP